MRHDVRHCCLTRMATFVYSSSQQVRPFSRRLLPCTPSTESRVLIGLVIVCRAVVVCITVTCNGLAVGSARFTLCIPHLSACTHASSCPVHLQRAHKPHRVWAFCACVHPHVDTFPQTMSGVCLLQQQQPASTTHSIRTSREGKEKPFRKGGDTWL